MILGTTKKPETGDRSFEFVRNQECRVYRGGILTELAVDIL